MSFFRKPTPLPVTQGGTGNVYNSYGYAIIGNGYSALLELTPSTSGNVMTSNGTTWTSAPPASSGSGTVNSGTAYQLAYYAASGTAVSTLGSLGTNGQVLTSGGAGVAPTWTTISAGSAATATALGTVYAKQTTGGSTPYLTAFGYNAGVSTTGASCTAIGTQALFTNSTGANGTAVGYQAGYSHNTGGITAVGYQAGYNDTNTYSNNDANVHVGYKAGYNTTTSCCHVFVGSGAGFTKGATGAVCTYVGNGAGYSNTTGAGNVGIGYAAMANGTTISDSVAIGDRCMHNGSPTGSYNVGIGSQALFSMTSASNNTAVGYQSSYLNTTSPNTTAIGSQALYSGGGYYDTAIGFQAGYSVTSGSNGSNTFVGYKAGQYSNALTTGQYCTYIGCYSSPSSATAISELVVCTGNSSVGKGSYTGYINGGTGGTYQGNNSATWSVTSDQRLKKNIVDNTIGLEQINGIRVRNFEYRLPEEVDPQLKETDAILKKGVQLGVIAQELQQVLPDCVRTESTGVMSVDSENITWHLINAVKELSAKVTALEARLGA